MPAKIVAVVDDIFFFAKIHQTAQQLGIPVEQVSPEVLRDHLASAGVGAILLDLNHRSGKAISTLQDLKNNPATCGIPVVAFLSHVQTDLARSARAAGCNHVLARSAFSQQLPQLLQELSKEENLPQ